MITIDRPVEWQEASPAPDSFGQTKYTWFTKKWVWAALLSLRGNETFESNQKVGISNARFVVRYESDYKVSDRIKDGSKIYDIVSVQEYQPNSEKLAVERNNYLLLYCELRDSSNTGNDG